MIEYGLQLYSVRDITKENLKDALRQVAEMGYTYVEFAGFFGNSAEDVKAWLDEYGLKVSDEEMAKRRAEMPIKKKENITGYLKRYAAMVSSADKGAILNY